MELEMEIGTQNLELETELETELGTRNGTLNLKRNSEL